MVSILVPIYNAAPYLRLCLDSIVSQTYRDLQIVLMDDGSQDDSLAICQEYAARDSRIEVYHQENCGVAATRNALLNNIRGDAFLFIDSDDWMEPDMVEFLLKRMAATDADIVVCSATESFDAPSSSNYSEQRWNRETTVREFLRHQQLNGALWNKLIRTDLLHAERFNDMISYGEDALFCWHLIQDLNRMLITDRQLYHYRINDQGLSCQKYGAKKMTGHLVWKQIADETKTLWPQYANIAIANYAISDMWQIYYAALADYERDENIRMFQKNIKAHLLLIFKSGLINRKKLLFATIAAFSYNACKWMV